VHRLAARIPGNRTVARFPTAPNMTIPAKAGGNSEGKVPGAEDNAADVVPDAEDVVPGEGPGVVPDGDAHQEQNPHNLKKMASL